MEQINEQHTHGGAWLREIVFGLNDGLVTTLVFIMAVSGIAPTHLLVIVLGEVLAGGISMALGGYLSARTEQEILEPLSAMRSSTSQKRNAPNYVPSIAAKASVVHCLSAWSVISPPMMTAGIGRWCMTN